MTIHVGPAAEAAALESGALIYVPLNKLKPSPSNARRTPHSPAAIEALAASIAVKGIIQPPVIEPEHDPDGAPTGFYFVTVGEGRRQAQLLRARRKEIRKTELVRCILDLMNDPHEISLDENVTRSDMHPADQFEAFRRLSEEKGWGPEEIGARFGVSAHIVRQRLRLASVSPRLIDLYRAGELHLDQLMAFGVCDDHARQEQVYETLTWNRNPVLTRRNGGRSSSDPTSSARRISNAASSLEPPDQRTRTSLSTPCVYEMRLELSLNGRQSCEYSLTDLRLCSVDSPIS